MQKIVHPKDYQYIHPIFSEIEQFFIYTSERKASESIIPKLWDNSFEMLYYLFVDNGEFSGACDFIDKGYKPLSIPEYNSNNIIVCFSSGKDSVACVQHYKECGYNVYLYHMPKINPSQNREETQQSIEIAKYFNCPIYVEDIKISGKHGWIEHPMKNMIIANGALHYGIENNIGTQIAFGNYLGSHVENDNFAFCGGDDIEMWVAYEEIINRILPDFEILLYLENNMQSLKSVCDNRELLDMTVSCLGRSSLRKRNHDWIENKFGVNLPTHRCGQCYKCAHEYIYMVENGLQPYNKQYYKYCLDRLKANLDKERYITTNTFTDVQERYSISRNSKFFSDSLL